MGQKQNAQHRQHVVHAAGSALFVLIVLIVLSCAFLGCAQNPDEQVQPPLPVFP